MKTRDENQLVRISELAEIKHGYPFEGQFFHEAPPGDVLLTPGNFAIGGGLKLDKCKFYRGPVPHEFVLAPGDLLVTMTDLSKQADTLGFPAIVANKPGTRFLHNQRLGKVVLHPDAPVEPGFLYYVFCSQDYRNEVLASATGTTVKHTSPTRIGNYRFRLPTRDFQTKVAHLLGSLDDKIELNRRTNETLEAIARTLFRSWFVDFDPVRAKADGQTPPGLDAATAKLFPDSFEPSALGPIPKGWHIHALQELCEIGRGSSPRPIHNFMGGSVPWIKIADATSAGGPFVYETKEFVTEAGATKSVWVQPGDLILSNSATCGVPVFVGLKGCIHDGWLHFQNLRKLSRGYLYHLLSSVSEHLVHIADGSVQKNLNTTLVGEQRVVVPPEHLVARFDALNDTLYRRLDGLAQESRTLAATRDALLPKLLSGEVSVA